MSNTLAHVRSHSLGDLLRRTARRYPNRTGLVDGELRLTFTDLDEIVNRVANSMCASGLNAGDRLALLSRNSWHYVVVSFAAARSGIVLVPINFMLGASEIAFILDDSGSRAFVAEEALTGVAEAALGLTDADTDVVVRVVICPEGVEGTEAASLWTDFSAWATHSDASNPEVVVHDDDVIRLMYTSGTESRPKGAMLTSRSLISQYVSCIVDGGMSADDVEVHALPMYHCAQLDCFLGPDVYLGATSIVLPGPDPVAVIEAIEREGATKFFAPPTVWISLLRSPAFDSGRLNTLRKGYYGASAMPVEVLREIQQRLPGVRLWNFYGQTELAPVATILPPDLQLSHAGSAGFPVLNVETAVVDDDDQPVPSGVVGEIVHRSPQATVGYWRNPEKNLEVFRQGWFHSGDLGVFAEDGSLTVVDRKKDMVKTGGENVASREVEEAIYLHPAVAEVAVFGVRDDRWIEAVTAAVVLKAERHADAEDIRDHCRAHLAGYKVPKHVVVVDSLPKNPSGKIVKRTLRDRFARLGEDAATTG